MDKELILTINGKEIELKPCSLKYNINQLNQKANSMINFTSYQSKWDEEYLKEMNKDITPEEIEVFRKAKELYNKYIDTYKKEVFKDNTKSNFDYNTFACCLTDDGKYVIFQSTPDGGFPPFYNYSFCNKKEMQEFIDNMQTILNGMVE